MSWVINDKQKDSSQETVISLLGMLFGTLLISYIPSTSLLTTWITLLSLLAIHLGTNYMAVSAVCMRTLNRQRVNLVFGEAFRQVVQSIDSVDAMLEREIDGTAARERRWMGMEWVRCREKVFERDGVLRFRGKVVGYCEVGVSLRTLISCLLPSTSSIPPTTTLTKLLALFEDTPYIIAYSPRAGTYYIVLKEHATSRDVLEAWLVVFLSAVFKDRVLDKEGWIEGLGAVVEVVRVVRGDVWKGLEKEGWDLSVGALETRGRVRVRVRE